MDGRRLADVRAGTPQESKSSGTGYLVGKHLVLTCRHVVVDDEGQPWSRIQVRLGRPGDGPQRRASASLIWVHPDKARDAALLRVEGEPFTQGRLVRWGWFACSKPVPYTGLGYLFVDYESGRGVEQLDGTLPPLGMSADGEYVLNQGPAPEPAAGRAWSGVSGAAVFCQGLLTAIVIRDDLQFGNRRLLALPVHELFSDHEFGHLITADTGAAPTPEAVELADFLQPPRNPVHARTPGSLLAASVEAVDFVGRHAEVTELTVWRDEPPLFTVMLVAGEGGQGKTRLAREFSAQARQAGWAAGFLLATRTTTGQDDSQRAREVITEVAVRLRETIRPVLLIADYAETRPEEVEALTDALISLPPAQPVRLLLLSRTAGDWWAGLTEVFGPDMTQHIDLAPLTDPGDARRDTYNAAVAGLARHLAILPEPPTERDPGESWDSLADRLARQPAALDDPRLGNVLTLQITALTDLLTLSTGETPVRLGVSEEQALIRHERGYLQRAAGKRKLFNPGVLSDRADDHERRTEAWSALERALAGTILLGPCDSQKTQGIGMLASGARPQDVVSWLAALYPPPIGDFGLGAVQPDRLAELLLGPILTQQADVLGQISALVDTIERASAALFTLLRTAAHPAYGKLSGQITELVASRPQPFAIAAPVLAATLPQAIPLHNGLLRLGATSTQSGRTPTRPCGAAGRSDHECRYHP